VLQVAFGWFERFSQTSRGREHDRESDAYQDDVYAFFVTCFHLKDWLKNDPAASASASDVESFVADSAALSICADLANGSKHLVLTTPRLGSGAKMGSRHYALTLGGGPPRISATYSVEAGGKRYDALKPAQECMADWTAYLERVGLLA
jgi:hypothetical protein